MIIDTTHSHPHRHADDAFAQQLAARDYRVTPQRQAVLEVLRSTDAHPDAQWVYEQVRQRIPNISLGTVYRTLNVLKEAGLISELSYGSSYSRFDSNTGDHHHAICTRCGRIADVTLDPALIQALEHRVEGGFAISSSRHDFFGLCPACR